MAYQRPKESSEAEDECRLLPASDLGAPGPKKTVRVFTTGCLFLLLLLLCATNAATAIYFTRWKKDTPVQAYSMT